MYFRFRPLRSGYFWFPGALRGKSNQKPLLRVRPFGSPCSGAASGARVHVPSLAHRRSPGIHALRPPTRRLHSACTNVAIRRDLGAGRAQAPRRGNKGQGWPVSHDGPGTAHGGGPRSGAGAREVRPKGGPQPGASGFPPFCQDKMGSPSKAKRAGQTTRRGIFHRSKGSCDSSVI